MKIRTKILYCNGAAIELNFMRQKYSQMSSGGSSTTKPGIKLPFYVTLTHVAGCVV